MTENLSSYTVTMARLPLQCFRIASFAPLAARIDASGRRFYERERRTR